jgi:2-C-methyl-D-erythritol 2,4-cyclodiphosphate synthase
VNRVGFGFDLHPLARGRPLVLGGVTVPSEAGLDGHSDADVLAHAVGEALLGSLALGDLGRHFPDSDPRYRGISSLVLLGKVMDLVRGRGGRLVNVDATVLAQAPRLSPHLGEMAARLAEALGVTVDAVSVKAKSPEGLGLAGRREGIAAMAAVSVEVTQGGDRSSNRG